MRAYAPLIGALLGAAFVGALIAIAVYLGVGALITVVLCLLGAVAGVSLGIEFK